jgi:hypothetical protein
MLTFPPHWLQWLASLLGPSSPGERRPQYSLDVKRGHPWAGLDPRSNRFTIIELNSFLIGNTDTNMANTALLIGNTVTNMANIALTEWTIPSKELQWVSTEGTVTIFKVTLSEFGWKHCGIPWYRVQHPRLNSNVVCSEEFFGIFAS